MDWSIEHSRVGSHHANTHRDCFRPLGLAGERMTVHCHQIVGYCSAFILEVREIHLDFSCLVRKDQAISPQSAAKTKRIPHEIQLLHGVCRGCFIVAQRL